MHTVHIYMYMYMYIQCTHIQCHVYVHTRVGHVERNSVYTRVMYFSVILVRGTLINNNTIIAFNLSRYASAISEMAIHNACRGAVQILGNPGNSQNQVSGDEQHA